jgi:hypothetical protein
MLTDGSSRNCVWLIDGDIRETKPAVDTAAAHRTGTPPVTPPRSTVAAVHALLQCRDDAAAAPPLQRNQRNSTHGVDRRAKRNPSRR